MFLTLAIEEIQSPTNMPSTDKVEAGNPGVDYSITQGKVTTVVK